MCAAPDQSVALPAGTDLTKETVLAGRVLADGSPVGGAFVRLLDGTGEFTAEVVASEEAGAAPASPANARLNIKGTRLRPASNVANARRDPRSMIPN